MGAKYKTDHLREVLDAITPTLDDILTDSPLHLLKDIGPDDTLPRELRRRDGICVATSWLLKELLKKEGIDTAPYSTDAKLRIGKKRYIGYHVLLRVAGGAEYIDPTYQQFYRQVGLGPKVAAQNSRLMKLYPDNDIAIIDSTTTDFQEDYAKNVHRIEQKLAKIGMANGSLIGTTLDEKVNVFNQVWDFGSYRRMFHPQKSLREAIAESV